MAGEYTVDVTRDVSGVLSLRSDWERMSSDFNADIDFYLAVLAGRGDSVRPHVVTIKSDGIVVAILACRAEYLRLEVPFGYKKLPLPRMRILTVIHGGVLGDDSFECVSKLGASVWESLNAGEADAAGFESLRVDSPSQKVLSEFPGFLTRDHFPKTLDRWRVELPNTYQDLYNSRSGNTRHNLKRYSKKLLAAFGDRLTVRAFRGTGELAPMIADTEEVARKGYLRGLGVGFRDDEQMRALLRLTAQKGWLRAYILYIDGKPCAFWNGVLYRRTFFTWTTGYDPDLNDFRPGTFLLQRMFEELCFEHAADAVDFGFGDAQYKRDWCDENRLHTNLFWFSPNLKGISLNVTRQALIAASRSVRFVVQRTGVLGALKKGWRNRLAAKTVSP